MRVLFCGYREWAIRIFGDIRRRVDEEVFLVDSPGELDVVASALHPDLCLFFGWSWMVPPAILQQCLCLCLHPSMLPKYRGGSPLQHQIIDGLTEGGLTLFRMTDEMDAGPILYQEPLSLEGNMRDILCRLTDRGGRMALRAIREFHNLKFRPQEGEPTLYRRRKPHESQIVEFPSALEVHNKVRALGDPYPNAFITCQDGSKLYLKETAL